MIGKASVAIFCSVVIVVPRRGVGGGMVDTQHSSAVLVSPAHLHLVVVAAHAAAGRVAAGQAR